MKNKWFFILLAVFAIIIATIIIITIRKEKRINHFEFPNTLIVNNYTKYKRADTVAMVVLNKIMLFDTIKLNIYYMISNMENDEYEVQGYIQKNPYEIHSYNIFIKKSSFSISIKKFISHELIHLQQIDNGNLIQIDNTKNIYKGDTIFFSKVKYEERPYEIDAFEDEDGVYDELFDLLYLK